MTLLFETRFLDFLIVVRQKMTFLESETKLGKIGMFLKENFDRKNLTFFI